MDERGQLYFDEAEISALARDCASADLQLIAHTMGERAQHLLCAAAQGIAKFKTPERVIALDKIPLLPTGKPDRQALRGRLSASENDR